MPTYTPPLRDMQFVMHELLQVVDDFKQMPRHADIDADTINAVLEEGGKFAAEVTFPLINNTPVAVCSRKVWLQSNRLSEIGNRFVKFAICLIGKALVVVC